MKLIYSLNVVQGIFLFIFSFGKIEEVLCLRPLAEDFNTTECWANCSVLWILSPEMVSRYPVGSLTLVTSKQDNIKNYLSAVQPDLLRT